LLKLRTDCQSVLLGLLVAWQLAGAMRKRKYRRRAWRCCSRPAGRKSIRLLDPKNDITLSSLQRAAAMVGRRVTIELV
jgi:antitoxin HicB